MKYLLLFYHPDITTNNILLYLFLVFSDIFINCVLKLWTYSMYMYFSPKNLGVEEHELKIF